MNRGFDLAIRYLQIRGVYPELQDMAARVQAGEPYAEPELRKLCGLYALNNLGLLFQYDPQAVASASTAAIYLLSGEASEPGIGAAIEAVEEVLYPRKKEVA